jgi:hypothetical protein
MLTFWNIETNKGTKVAGPYATIEAALDARHKYFLTSSRLFVVEYEFQDCPARAKPVAA